MLGLLALIFSLLPEFCMALGLGQIKLYSYLNEPLDAEIELYGAQEIDINQLTASLASAQDFKRAEMTRPYYLTQLRFHVVQDHKHTIIKVTTDEAVTQPYMEYLIDLTWPTGRLVRGYTLLLDPAPMGSAHKRRVKKEPVRETSTIDRHALLRMHERLAEQRQKDKLARILSKPTMLARMEENTLTETDSGEGLIAGNPAVKNLENLFEAVDRQEVPKAIIEKSTPVAIEEETSSMAAEEEQAAILMQTKEQNANEQNTHELNEPNEPNEPIVFTEPAAEEFSSSKALINSARENSLLLSSGLSLLLVVSFTVWALRQAARTGISPKLAFATPKSSHSEMPSFDDQIMIKLSLARQYLDIKDIQSAKEVLEEIIEEGNISAQNEAKALLAEIQNDSYSLGARV